MSQFTAAGKVLDLGGGGEGIISRVVGDRVVSIDSRREELTETPDIGLKIVMDATDLKFTDCAFDTVTAFYSLMYMSFPDIRKAAQEVYRVIKPGGYAFIFDTEIPAPREDVFIKQLKVILPHETITTGYGVGWTRAQTKMEIIEIFSNCGFSIVDAAFDKSDFVLKFEKPTHGSYRLSKESQQN